MYNIYIYILYRCDYAFNHIAYHVLQCNMHVCKYIYIYVCMYMEEYIYMVIRKVLWFLISF